MWILIVSVPDHCLSFYFKDSIEASRTGLINGQITQNKLKIENENFYSRKTKP